MVNNCRFLPLFSFLILIADFSMAQDTVFSPELEQALSAAGDQELPVIMTVRGKPDLSEFRDLPKDMKRRAIVAALRDAADRDVLPLKALLENNGARGLQLLWIIHGMACKAQPAVLQSLVSISAIERIDLDGVISAPRNSSSPEPLPEWNVSSINAPDLWDIGLRGQGTVIAAMDTGADLSHPDLASKYRGGDNSWFDPYGQHAFPYDALGHGTNVLGVLVGGSAGGTAIGVAPDARWIATRAFNDAGQASYSAIHLGFQWLLDPDMDPNTNDAPDVVNISWGLNNVNGCNSEFAKDITALAAADIAVVAAAGNNGPYPSSSISPANLPGVLSVGAVDSNYDIASFSSRGPNACDASVYPHLTAPGVGIRTTGLTYGAFPDSYNTVSGTSVAAPHVAGALVLLNGAYPYLSVEKLEAALLASAQDLGALGQDNTFGWGFPNLKGALEIIAADQDKIISTLTSWDYGELRIGGESAKTFLIKNDSRSRILLGTVSLVPDHQENFFIQKDNCSRRRLAAGFSCRIEVVFSPASEGVKSAWLVVPYKSSRIENSIRVSLAGTGIHQYRLSIFKSGTGSGTVTGAPGSILCGTFCSEDFASGSTIMLQAVPDEGSVFTGWSDDYSGTDSTISVLVSADLHITANFSESDGVTVVSPNGGESLKAGSTSVVRWTYSGTPGPFAQIELNKGGTFQGWIAVRTPVGRHGKGLYKWKIPADLPPGSDYRIRILINSGHESVADSSDANFKIRS